MKTTLPQQTVDKKTVTEHLYFAAELHITVWVIYIT